MHPVKMMMESKLEVHKDKTLREATEMAYKVCQICFSYFWRNLERHLVHSVFFLPLTLQHSITVTIAKEK